MKSHVFGAVLAVSCVVFSPVVAGADVDSTLLTPAPRVDSGLGELPHYTGSPAMWLYAQPAAKADSGLGVQPAVADTKEVWLYMQPAPKVDSGLGELTAPAHVAGRTAHGG